MRICAILFFLFILASLAWGVDRTWLLPVNGDYSTAANWTGATVPVAGDRAFTTNGGPYTLTVSANVTNLEFHINHFGTTCLFSSSAAIMRTSNFYVGQSTKGTHCTVSNGGTIFATKAISVGDATFSGTNSMLVSGVGTFLVCTNIINSSFIKAGNNGFSNAIILSGGAVMAADSGRVGAGNGTNNYLEVTGAGSVFSNINNFVVGQTSVSNMCLVTNGGLIWSGIAVIGTGAVSFANTLIITGSGSKLVCSNSFALNNRVDNNFNLLSSGNLTATNVFIGSTNGMLVNGGSCVVLCSNFLVTAVSKLIVTNGTHTISGRTQITGKGFIQGPNRLLVTR